ncbi:unnamed protein product [Adineta steineri]|uniref:G-protein coupled receptors family 1 profile domain-containing protein n=1 Tax=Adineta steineri TaxID=433720 RepID=A0A815SUS6_9BILA|nr:unnamed protein product [Adineta steineri]CAF4100947.1 unnamed protein product [Adineta steineri]
MTMSSSSNLINTLETIQNQIIRYVYPLWLIFGTIGCLFNLVVFSRPKLRTTSCCVYFFAASAIHLLTFSIGLGPVLYSLNNPDPQIQILSFCKIRGYLFQLSIILSRWFVAFACIDRFASTSAKVQLRNFAKTRIAYRIIIIIIIFWSLICIHRLIFYEIKGNLCGIISNTGAALYHTAYVIFAVGIFPSVTMIICAWLIRKNLIYQRSRRAQFSLTIIQRHSLNQQVLNILFMQIICYIVFTLPQMGNLIFSTISTTIPNRSDQHLAIEKFVLFIGEFMLYLFGVTSFYLYTLTSRTFRLEFIKFIRLVFVFHCKRQITPIIVLS